MTFTVASAITQASDSAAAGREAAASIAETVPAPKAVLAFLTVNHDAKAALSAIEQILDPETPVLGCSTQGMMGRRFFAEDGYILGLMGFGGDVEAVTAHTDDIAHDTKAKGRRIAEELIARSTVDPEIVILHWDSLCGVDMDQFLAGMEEVISCPVVGGAGSHSWGPLQTTYQYLGDHVSTASAVALALGGDLRVETAISNGVSPVGIDMTVTEADANVLLGLDGLRAADVWTDVAGSATRTGGDQTAALSIGVPVQGEDGSSGFLVRAAFGFDDRGGAILQSAIPTGSRVMLHHRTFEDALEGSETMARDLKARLDGATVLGVLGFECGGRTKPFLGIDTCRAENDRIQEILAPDAAWLGLLPWGEIHPVAGHLAFNNYTFPMVVFAER